MENIDQSLPNIDQSLFEPATLEERASAEVTRESVTYWQDASRRFKKNKVALISMCLIGVISICAITIPMVSKYSYAQINRGVENQTSSFEHPFGTDTLGRDLLVRCMIGARISILIGMVSATLVVLIGITYGATSGYFGGMLDIVMMRIVDVINAVPSLLIVVLLSVVLKAPMDTLFLQNENLRSIGLLGPGLFSIFIVISLLYWTSMARMTRGQMLALKNQEFVTAARALGASHSRIIFKHLVPNAMGAIIVSAMVQIPNAIFVEAFLSFLGLGVSAPMVSLGSLTSNAISGVYSYPYQLLFPAALISIIILCFNLVGDGLRDALDPRMKK